MKILLITNIYPYNRNLEKDKNSRALHNIIKLWDSDVEVIRPLFFPRELKGGINAGVFQRKRKFLIDNIGVKAIPIWKIPATNVYFYNTLIKYVRNNKIDPDIIISHRLHSSIGAARLAKIKKKPFILGIHNSDISSIQKNEMKDFFFDIFNQADRIACRSQSILNEVMRIYPDFSHKCFIAFSGIEKEIITPLKDNLEKMQEWKMKKRPIQFISVARLKKLKNIDVNLKALANLNSNIKWEYTIIGDGEEMSRLKGLAKELKIIDKVIFMGYQTREKVLHYMQKSDIFIMVSAPETFGLVYIEAMAKGCLVIGAYDNGIDGVVEDGTNGFLCRPRNNAEVSEKIEAIFDMDCSRITGILSHSNQTIKNYTEEKASSTYMKKIKEAQKANYNGKI